MRLTLLFILLIVFSTNVSGQSAEHFQNDNEGNVIAIFGNQDSAHQNVAQTGAENLFFIYSMPDSSPGDVEASQDGFSNRIISIIAEGKGSFFQRFDQTGERNKVQVLQKSTQDSTSKDINKIDVKQKGSGNSVTIIQ